MKKLVLTALLLLIVSMFVVQAAATPIAKPASSGTVATLTSENAGAYLVAPSAASAPSQFTAQDAKVGAAQTTPTTRITLVSTTSTTTTPYVATASPGAGHTTISSLGATTVDSSSPSISTGTVGGAAGYALVADMVATYTSGADTPLAAASDGALMPVDLVAGVVDSSPSGVVTSPPSETGAVATTMKSVVSAKAVEKITRDEVTA